MSAAFPTGTGVALKVITSAKQLVDGALYLFQLAFGKPKQAHYTHLMQLARLDLSRKQYGVLPLFHDDAPGKNLHIRAEWKAPTQGQGYEVKLLRVMYHTTHAPHLAPATRQDVPQAVFQTQGQEEPLALAA